MRFHVLQHLESEPPALIATCLQRAGHEIRMIHLWQGEAVSDIETIRDGLIIMGGPQSANDVHLQYIRDELMLIRQAISDGIPMLGICLGSQLMARAAGGQVTASPVRELGWYPVFPTAEASEDPLFAGLPENGLHVFQWHGETFTLPRHATLLATHPEVPQQAFRLGEGQYGLQFHIEINAPMIDQWIKAGESERAALGPMGIEAIHKGNESFLNRAQEFCSQLVRAWLENIENRRSSKAFA